MTSLRWLAWPTRRKSDGAWVALAHALVRSGDTLKREALCGELLDGAVLGLSRVTAVGLIAVVDPARPHEKCPHCDAKTRTMGGPHPKGTVFDPTLYDPHFTFEDWAGEAV